MKKIVFLVIVLFIGLNSFGQSVEKEIKKFPVLYLGQYSNKDFFDKSDYIFEGELITAKNYINDDTTKVFYSSVIKVNHVYKGVIDADTIEFVVEGGTYTDAAEWTILDYNSDFTFDFSTKHAILFAKKRKSATFRDKFNFVLEPFDNVSWAAIFYTNDFPERNFTLYGLNDLYFRTVDDFHKYIKRKISKRNNIVLPAKEVEPYKKRWLSNKYKNPELEEFMNYQFKLVKQAKRNDRNVRGEERIANRNKKKLNIKSTDSVEELTLSIRNQELTGTSTIYFEFDVYANANNSNNFYFNPIASIDFNTSIRQYKNC